MLRPWTTLATASDENYFPLVRGLVLSVRENPATPSNLRLAFLDLGCRKESLDWLAANDVEVVQPDRSALGPFGSPGFGYHRAQICRPYLPAMFPDAEVVGWIDCDTWFQDTAILGVLAQEAVRFPEDMLVAPEVHYTYTKINDEVRTTHNELRGYYAALYGDAVADELCVTPSVNSGFFMLHRDAPLWQAWQAQIEDIYGARFEQLDPVIRHFGEQISLNMLLKQSFGRRYFDPLYNYLCLWNPPTRDEDGVVRVAYPPYPAVGMLHLAGGWRYFGRSYLERGLLYRGGAYLTEPERERLMTAAGGEGFR